MTENGSPDNSEPQGSLLRALLPIPNLRVVVAVSTGVAREATRRHGAVAGAAAALGRAVTAGALLATLTKDRERVTAEITGGGDLGPLVIDANASGDVRVYVKNPSKLVPAIPGARIPIGAAVGTAGLVRVTRDLGLRETVSGQTALVDGEIDTDLEKYLTDSEQVPSVLACEALIGSGLDVAIAAGVLFQTLPGSEGLPILERLRAELRGGSLVRALAAATATPTPEALAETLLGDLAPDLLALDERPLRFFCPCSKARAIGTLGVLSLDDLAEMVAEARGAEVTCEFCRAKHTITAAELEAVHAEARAGRPS
jgi:molecular chaperone Hsp33